MATKLKEAHVSHVKQPEEKIPDARGGLHEDSPRLPHDRDESAYGRERKGPDPIIKQAYDDIEAGQMDTDRRGMPGVEEVERSKDDHAQEDIPASSRMPPSTPEK